MRRYCVWRAGASNCLQRETDHASFTISTEGKSMKAIAGSMIAACAFVCAVAAATPLQDCASSSAPAACLDAKLKAANKQLNATLKATQDRLEQLQARGKRPVLGAFIDSQRK